MPRELIEWPVSGQLYTMRDFVNHMKQLLRRIEELEAELDKRCPPKS